MTGIVAFAINNWRMTLGLMLCAVFGGIIALNRLSVDAEPDIPVPFITVQVVTPGISPEDSERLLVRPLETELKSIEGLKEMQGIASTNVGLVVLEFNASFDQDQTVQEVNEKVSRAKADFPLETREPFVEELSTSTFPVIVVNLFGDAPERELQELAKDIQQRIEGLPAVLEATISGERTDVLEAILDPALIESTGISFDEISAAIARNNSLIAAGALETQNGKFNVKLPGLIENTDDLADLVIRTGQGGSIIRMRDIANVRAGYKDVDTYARFDGKPSVSIEVSKRQGENIIEMIQAVRVLVDDIKAMPDWPSTVQLEYSQDRSRDTREMISSLFSSIINAVILVFIVCIAALGWRSALFVGWAIPASFLMALFMFYVQGASLNMMIMFGLILSVGVLVDSAIVIVEYANRKLSEGMDRKTAFLSAGQRMFWPIVSSTATTLAAFLPLLFWDDLTGKFMSYFPRTMIFVLTASLLMAVIFLPTMGALIGPRKLSKVNKNAAALAGGDGDPMQVTGLTGYYVRLISTLVKWPILVILGTIILMLAIVGNFKTVMSETTKPVEFFTQDAGDNIYILARSRGNTTPADALAIAEDIERRIADVTGIQSVYSVAGAGAGGASGGGAALRGPANVPTDTVAKIYTELLDFDDRPSSNEIVDELRERVSNIPGIYTEVTSVSQGPPIGKDLAVQLTSNDPDALKRATQKLRDKFNATDGLIEIEDTLPLPGIEWQLEVDRAEAGRLGLDVSRIGAAVSFLTEGSLVGYYRPLGSDEEVDIRLRYPATSRDLGVLDSLRIQTSQGALPLSTVVNRSAQPSQDKIDRIDQELVYTVQANTAEGFATNLQVEEIRAWLESDQGAIPNYVTVKFLGQDEENAAAGEFFRIAGLAILFMMSMILLLQFNSFYHVFLTLLAVILSIFGVILGLTYYPYISIILTGTGVIALAGIVVNNNIVLIDSYQILLKRGYEPVRATIMTAAQRIRPVILTTLTTIVGLMPLILGWQADIFTGEFSTKGTSTSAIWAPISYVIAAGLAFATILTLIITPVLLAMPYVMKQRSKNLYRWMADKGLILNLDELKAKRSKQAPRPSE